MVSVWLTLESLPLDTLSCCVCAQVDAIRAGTSLVLQCRKAQQANDVVLDASAKLLKVVPEVRQPT